MAAPSAGTAYPILLGESFASSAPSDAGGLHLLRYDFKPASAGRVGDGLLKVDKNNRQVALELPNSTEGAPALRFNGTYEQAGDGCDCIATFDGEQWHLELLSGQCRNIRVARSSSGHLTDPPVKRPRPTSAAAEQPQQTVQQHQPQSQTQAQPDHQPQPSHAEPQEKVSSRSETDRRKPRPVDARQPHDSPEPAQQAQHQPAPSEPQPSRQQSAAAVPDWQMGFVPEQDTSEDEDGSQQSDDDSNGDF